MIRIFFLTVLSWTNPFPADSLRMETIQGRVFIIHQIDEHETLYGISKRYGVSIASILEVNPTADRGLEIGQLLKVPYIPKTRKVTDEGTIHKVAPKETLFSISRLYNVTVDELKAWNNLKDNGLSTGQELIVKKRANQGLTAGKEDNKKSSPGKHTVEAGETLFFVAKKYGVTVTQLKDWNKMQGNEVTKGDVLIVVQPADEVAAITKPVEVKPALKQEIKPVDDKQQNTVVVSESVRGSDEVKEGGLAELIEGTEGNRKYLALHRKAKVGTIMKVRNELNNREVFVRVVGPLPDTGVNDKIVIKISKSAYDRLGAIDPKFRAEVTYYK
jgi:LysM repeat protein